jgi:hypothetical protein
MLASGKWCVGECFDLIVGTSTGGVIALGAGLLRMTLPEVGRVYDTMAGRCRLTVSKLVLKAPTSIAHNPVSITL